MGRGPLLGGGVVHAFCFVFFYFRANVSLLYLVLAEPFCSPRTGVLCCSAHARTGGGMFCIRQNLVVGVFSFLLNHITISLADELMVEPLCF